MKKQSINQSIEKTVGRSSAELLDQILTLGGTRALEKAIRKNPTARQACAMPQTNGGELIARKKYNPMCDADNFLNVVLVKTPGTSRSFVVWTENIQDGGYYYGVYCTTIEEAMKAYNCKGHV